MLYNSIQNYVWIITYGIYDYPKFYIAASDYPINSYYRPTGLNIGAFHYRSMLEIDLQ